MNHGFVRVAAAVPQVRVADCAFNADCIIESVRQADAERAQVICFPELCVTACTCGDLFHHTQLLCAAEEAIRQIALQTCRSQIVIIIGAPLRADGRLYNTAVVMQSGRVLGVVPKTYLSAGGGWGEARWFAPAGGNLPDSMEVAGNRVPFGTNLLFSDGCFTCGIELGADLWVPVPPSTQHAMHGAEIIFNLSASHELAGKQTYRRQLVEQQSARCLAGYVYAPAGVGESTTDHVFAGGAMVAENGMLLAEGTRFSREAQLLMADIDVERLQAERLRHPDFTAGRSAEAYRVVRRQAVFPTDFELKRSVSRYPFIPASQRRAEQCADLFAIQTAGLAKRWEHTQAQTLVLGISGGLDSTLALLVCVRTADLLGYDRSRVVGVTMPGFGTTDRTYTNALGLMRSLGITMQEISIKDACLQHFEDIGHDVSVRDVTYENAQARERTQVLMDVGNRMNGLVVGTGDLSELALGWATYNGDHMSMYGVNGGVPKTLVRCLVEWVADEMGGETGRILHDVLDTPVSPELLPADEGGRMSQKTEDIVGPYELHDFFLYYFVRFGFGADKVRFLARHAFHDVYTDEVIDKWLATFVRRFFTQQFKRSCLPDGPAVGSVGLSPRGGWCMPSDAVTFQI